MSSIRSKCADAADMGLDATGVASIWQGADSQTFRISKPLHTGRSDSVTGEWAGHTVRAMAADSR